MFSFSLTINLELAFSCAQVIFLSTSLICLRWTMFAGEFMSVVRADSGDRVTSFNPELLLLDGKSSFGCEFFCFFFLNLAAFKSE